MNDYKATLERLKVWALDNGSHDLQYALRRGYPTGLDLEREYVLSLCPKIPGAQRLTWSQNVSVRGLRRMPNEASQKLLSALHREVRLIGLLQGIGLEISRILSIRFLNTLHTGAQIKVTFPWLENPITVTYLVMEQPN